MTIRAMMCVAAVLWMTACATASIDSDPAGPVEKAAEVPAESGSTASEAVPAPAPNEHVARSAPALSEHVARSAFTTGVADREPEDNLTTLANDATRVYYFTEIRDMEGKTVIHRWEYGDQSMGDVAFDVRGPRWRVHSVKTLDPSWIGQWAVTVVDADGTVLSKDQFNYTPAKVDASASASEDEPVPPAAPSAE